MSPYDTVIFGITRATGRSSPEKKQVLVSLTKINLNLKLEGFYLR